MNSLSQHKKTATLFFLLILIIIVFLIQSGIQEIKKWLEPEGNLLKLMIIFQLTISILLPVILYLKILKHPWKENLGLYLPPLKKAIIAIFIGFFAIITISMVLPRIIPPSPELMQKSSSIASYDNFLEFLLSFITVAIFASVVDELFFRGILLRGVMKHHGKISAIVITAIFTALFHTWEPFKLTHAFIMGLIFATAVVWTNSVYTSIMLHGLHNFLSLLPQ